MRPVIIVFAKAPRAGHVKTRLTPYLTPAQAVRIHIAFVQDTLHNLLDFPGADVELHTDQQTDAWNDFLVSRRGQHEGHLGLKMFHALREALEEGRPQAIILGSDAPDLPTANLTELLCSPADIALGPCADGGYYAIAARRVDPQMFEGVEWSSSRECSQTASACRAAGLTVALGPEWCDFDNPQDLERLSATSRAPRSSEILRAIRVSL